MIQDFSSTLLIYILVPILIPIILGFKRSATRIAILIGTLLVILTTITSSPTYAITESFLQIALEGYRPFAIMIVAFIISFVVMLLGRKPTTDQVSALFFLIGTVFVWVGGLSDNRYDESITFFSIIGLMVLPFSILALYIRLFRNSKLEKILFLTGKEKYPLLYVFLIIAVLIQGYLFLINYEALSLMSTIAILASLTIFVFSFVSTLIRHFNFNLLYWALIIGVFSSLWTATQIQSPVLLKILSLSVIPALMSLFSALFIWSLDVDQKLLMKPWDEVRERLKRGLMSEGEIEEFRKFWERNHKS